MALSYIAWFNQIDHDDLHHVGEHGTRLGNLKRTGIPIPDGFILTSLAFNRFLEGNNLERKAKHLLTTLNHDHPSSLTQISEIIKKYFVESELPSDLKLDIYSAYKKLGGSLNDSHVKLILSPLSSASILNVSNFSPKVKGEASLIHKIKEYWAASFTNLNIAHNHNSPTFTKSVIVQKAIEPDKSGKIYTIDPFNKDKTKMIIRALYGHFEDKVNLVSIPDHYVIKKDTLELITKDSTPQLKMAKEDGAVRKVIDVPKNLRKQQKLFATEIGEIINNAKLIEKLSYFPQEIDWIINGKNLYITHTKPLTH